MEIAAEFRGGSGAIPGDIEPGHAQHSRQALRLGRLVAKE
jgi:hypothetical protein